MHIKRFRGKKLSEALKKVRSAFGDDAVILSTRSLRDGAEVLAAVDFDIEAIEKASMEEDTIKLEMSRLREELGELKHLFSSMVKDAELKELAYLGSGALELYQGLMKKGIDERLSKRLVKVAASSMNGSRSIEESCLRILHERVALVNPLSNKEKPRMLALVGPTGVGKTTTIAKLAGRLTGQFNAKVGMVSVDTSGNGSNDLLRNCAKKFGTPLGEPHSKNEFNKIMWSFRDKDVVLVDTPGRSPSDAEGIERLKNVLYDGLPIKTGLVLSMTSGGDNLTQACRGFEKLPIDCHIFTKIDEVNSFGSIINTYTLTKKPIAYLCNGQRIPQDIGVASHEVIGNLVFGGGISRC